MAARVKKENRTRMQANVLERTRLQVCKACRISEEEYRLINFELGMDFAERNFKHYPDIAHDKKYGYWQAFMYYSITHDELLFRTTPITSREEYIAIKQGTIDCILEHLINIIDL